MSHESLKDILQFDPYTETMFGILGQMAILRELLRGEATYRPLLPFLEVYFRVTKSVVVVQLTNAHMFRSREALERLDVHFALLYFNALFAFLTTGNCLTPWRTYFEYCQKSKGSAFVQMLLGINAHINGDLAVALRTCSYEIEEDFLTINTLLQEQIRGMLLHLVRLHGDLISAGAFLASRTSTELFKDTIVQWREIAWTHGSAWSDLSAQKEHEHAEHVAAGIIRIFSESKYYLRPSVLKKELRALTASIIVNSVYIKTTH